MSNQIGHNIPTADRSDDLEELVKLMNEQQQLNFKQAVVRQTIHYVSKRLPSEENDEGERFFIAMANQWLEQPTDKNAENAMMATVADCIDGGARYFDYPTYFHEPALAAGESAYGASKHALAAAEADSSTAHQWQMTVAWTILNNADLPPLK